MRKKYTIIIIGHPYNDTYQLEGMIKILRHILNNKNEVMLSQSYVSQNKTLHNLYYSNYILLHLYNHITMLSFFFNVVIYI
jgi:hypothetical protein